MSTYEFSSSIVRMVEAKGSTDEDTKSRYLYISRALDWHFPVTDIILPSVRMGHKTKARYKLVMNQTSVTTGKCRPTSSFCRSFWKNGNSTWRKHEQFESHSP